MARRAAHPRKDGKGGGIEIHDLSLFVWSAYWVLDFIHRDIPPRSTIGHSAVIFLYLGTGNTHKTFRISLMALLRGLCMESLEDALVPQHPRRSNGLAADSPRIHPLSFEFWQTDDLDGRLALESKH